MSVEMQFLEFAMTIVVYVLLLAAITIGLSMWLEKRGRGRK